MSDTDMLVRARLSSEQSLAVFRAVLSAASRPGTVVPLPDDAASGVPAAVIPVLALADLDVSVATLDQSEDEASRWQALIQGVTGCCSCALADADMVVALSGPTPTKITALRVGTANAPERGARLFMACRFLTAGIDRNATSIRLRGPGATNGRTFSVVGLDREVIAALAAANRWFPAGVDSWLVADDGAVVGIPRSARIELVDEPSHQGAR